MNHETSCRTYGVSSLEALLWVGLALGAPGGAVTLLEFLPGSVTAVLAMMAFAVAPLFAAWGGFCWRTFRPMPEGLEVRTVFTRKTVPWRRIIGLYRTRIALVVRYEGREKKQTKRIAIPFRVFDLETLRDEILMNCPYLKKRESTPRPTWTSLKEPM